jgi:predicted DNA-binding protein YlxM (UPF0122 family)
MVGKAEFTPEEWKTLASAPMLATMAMTLAEPGGILGMIKESAAGVSAVLEPRNAPDDTLMKHIAEEFTTSEGRSAVHDTIKETFSGKPREELKGQIMAALQRAGEIADQKAGADAAPYKMWLKHIAEHVAEASSEGGFFGFGGVQVSEAEKASIHDIASALKM